MLLDARAVYSLIEDSLIKTPAVTIKGEDQKREIEIKKIKKETKIGNQEIRYLIPNSINLNQEENDNNKEDKIKKRECIYKKPYFEKNHILLNKEMGNLIQKNAEKLDDENITLFGKKCKIEQDGKNYKLFQIDKKGKKENLDPNLFVMASSLRINPVSEKVVISRKPEINPDFCKDLVVINTYGLNKNSDMAKAIQELTGNTNINVPFVPLSTCNRHVYVLSKDLLLREFQSENNNLPILSKLFNSGSRDDTFQIYKGDEAMKWVTTWVSGSLNKGKYCQDTYNKKTVIDRLDIFSKLSNGDNSKKRQEICNELREKINKEVEGINVTEKNSDEKLKWLKEKRENIKSVNDLNPYRILDEQDRNAFCNYVGTIFNMASRITSGLEALKNSDQIKPLWSGLIKKENLDVIKEENVELFKEVMDTRTSFAEEYVKLCST